VHRCRASQEEALARKEAARQASRRPRGPRNDIEELIYQYGHQCPPRLSTRVCVCVCVSVSVSERESVCV
jgi:hypothetical protein